MGETLLPTVQIERNSCSAHASGSPSSRPSSASDDARQLVATGSIKAEIVRAAQELGADLIVLGSRERRGLSILLNFTEDTVLHAAPCDVLAVRLR